MFRLSAIRVHVAPIFIALVCETAFAAAPNNEPLPMGQGDSLAPAGVLDVDRLVEEVIARNPTVEAMIAAWQAAAARYPQEVSLEDPMFEYAVAPDSWGDPTVESGYMVMASQKLPWPGKRQLRGRVASAEASAAASQVDDARLRLAEAAKLSFVDYYLATRQLALNGDTLREVNEFHETATAKLRVSTGSQQDVLQTDVELAMLAQRKNQLERDARVAVVRINTLLHREPNHPLPPPPAQLEPVDNVPSVETLRDRAIQARPDLAAMAAEIEAAQSAAALACKDFYPDADVYAKYDAFWQEKPLRTAVGMSINVPLYRDKRWGSVREARATLERRRAEYQQLTDEIANDVAAAHARLTESRQTALLYSGQILPAAQKNVESARAGYTAGNVDFLRLIDAQRQLITLRDQEAEAVSEYRRSLAQLERAVGASLDLQAQ